MAKHPKTMALIQEAYNALAENHPMTVRQVYYQLVSRQVLENNRGRYQALCDALVYARQEGIIPWDWIEDRLRQPRCVGMWENLADFAETAKRAYRRDVWENQSGYLECWLEKDALSGIVEDVLRPFGVTLNVGRGYDGWASIRNAAERFRAWDGPVTILYFGDLDPSGEDMIRSLAERLAFFGCYPEIVKCALTLDDVDRYHLPPDPTKRTDSRRAAYVAEFGDVSVELDALPVGVLRARVKAEVEARLDLAALEEVRKAERWERAQLVTALGELTQGEEVD